MLSVGIESCGMQWISCKDSCGSWFDVVSIFADLTRYLKVNIKMPPSSKQELWWNGFGPNFQTAEALEIQKLLLNSVLFSFQTGALRCLAKRPAHFPCSSHVFHHFHIGYDDRDAPRGSCISCRAWSKAQWPAACHPGQARDHSSTDGQGSLGRFSDLSTVGDSFRINS